MSKYNDIKHVASILYICHFNLSLSAFPAPTGRVQDLKGWLVGLNIYLSWGNVSEQMQRGFIKGYNLSYISDGGDEGNVVISGKRSYFSHL